MGTYDLGKQFGKPDWERLGIFVEMPYMNGARYSDRRIIPEQRKGPSFLNSGRKTKCGTQSGYFESEFKRIFEGEGITRRVPRQKSTQIPLLLGGRTKKHSTPGDYFGTFTKHEAFSPVLRQKPPRVPDPGNFTTRNGRKGGPGYADICLNKYPEHSSDRYGAKPVYKSYGQAMGGPFVSARYPQSYFETKPYTESPDGNAGPCYIVKDSDKKGFLGGTWVPIGPTKWQGGCHGGTLNPFPTGEPDPYVSSEDANKYVSKYSGPIFYPPYTVDKSMFTSSIMARSVDLRVNAVKYKRVNPSYIKYLRKK